MNKTQKIHGDVCLNFKKKENVTLEENAKHEDSDHEIMVVNPTLKSQIFTRLSIDKINSNNCGNIKGRKSSIYSKNDKVENRTDNCCNQPSHNILKKTLLNNVRKSNVESGIVKQPQLEKRKTEIKIGNVPLIQKNNKKQTTANDKISYKKINEIKNIQLGLKKEIQSSNNSMYSNVNELKEKQVDTKSNEQPKEESNDANSRSSISNISEDPSINVNCMNKVDNNTYEQIKYNMNVSKVEDHTPLFETYENTFKRKEEEANFFSKYDSTSVIKYDDFELNEINEELNKIIEEERIIQEEILRLTDRELTLLMQRNTKRNQKKIKDRQKQKELEKEGQEENQQQYEIEII